MRGIMAEIVLRLTICRAAQLPLPGGHVLTTVPGVIELADRAAAAAAESSYESRFYSVASNFNEVMI